MSNADDAVISSVDVVSVRGIEMSGPDGSVPGWLGAIIGGVIAVIGSLVTYARAAMKTDTEVQGLQGDLAELSASLKEMQKSRQAEHQELREVVDMSTRRVGETVASIRESVNILKMELKQTELWGRDNYSRKDEIRQMREEIRSDFVKMAEERRQMREEIKLDLSKLYDKLDRVVDKK